MYMTLGCNPQIYFQRFCSFNVVIFGSTSTFVPQYIDTGYLVNATPPTTLARSS